MIRTPFLMLVALLGLAGVARAQVPAQVAPPAPGEPPAVYKPSASAPVYFNPTAKYTLGVWLSPVHWFEPLTGHDEEGLYVTDVVLNGPANKAGIERGDIIVRVDGQRITNLAEFKLSLNASASGKVKVRTRDWRTGKYLDIDAELTPASPPVNPNEGP